MTEGLEKPSRILIVDDNPQIHSDFRRSLSFDRDDSGLAALEEAIFGGSVETGEQPVYRIDFAHQGQEALEKVVSAKNGQDPYSLAFVDMRMPPGWDGLRTIEELWKVDERLQIVICTAYSDYSWEDIQKRIGRTDRLLILRKPFDRVEVRQLAAALTEKWRLAAIANLKRQELEELVRVRTRQLEEALKQDRLRLDLLQTVVDHRAGELRHAALHDKLTGLPNRTMLSDRIAQALAQESQRPFSVLFLDLDDFKLVNDTLGHEAGDQLLKEVARRLLATLREAAVRGSALAARLGGDEFVVLLEETNDTESVAQNILTTLTEPIMVLGRAAQCGVSIGIASGHSGETVEQVLRNADIAMYQAKRRKNHFVTFTPQMHEQVVERVSLEEDLRRAMKRNELEMHYQPIVSLSTGELEGFEALLRWQHPKRGWVPPEQFVSLAESTGLIHPLGLWTLEQSARQTVEWIRKYPARKFWVGVNLSTRQLADEWLVPQLRRIVNETGVDPSRMVLEITEGFIANHEAAAEKLLAVLQTMKFGTCIDDFGTGHSALGRLPKLPIHGVKIDRLFVQQAATQRKYAAIINTIITLARHMNANVVAEGLESAEQTALLQALECDLGQGYYFSRPLTAEEAEQCFTMTWRTGQGSAVAA